MYAKPAIDRASASVDRSAPRGRPAIQALEKTRFHFRSGSEVKHRQSAFTQALADLGWTDGRNVRMDLRWAGVDCAARQRVQTGSAIAPPQALFQISSHS